MDYSQRLYLVVAIRDGVVYFLERSDVGGPWSLHNPTDPEKTDTISISRKPMEAELIGVRSMPLESFERVFDIVANISGGDLVKKWMENRHWGVTREAAEIIDRVIYIEDSVEYLRWRAAHRNHDNALERARRIRKNAETNAEELPPAKKYNFAKEPPPTKKRKPKFTSFKSLLRR
jgi:hypothetical protein